MNEIYSKAIGLVISLVGVYVAALINKLIKNKELNGIVQSFHQLIKSSVLNIKQTYVDSLKKDGEFTADAQKRALNKCLDLVKANMPKEIKTWLVDNFDDIDAYIKSQIESEIAEEKK